MLRGCHPVMLTQQQVNNISGRTGGPGSSRDAARMQPPPRILCRQRMLSCCHVRRRCHGHAPFQQVAQLTIPCCIGDQIITDILHVLRWYTVPQDRIPTAEHAVDAKHHHHAGRNGNTSAMDAWG
jgi:hypothetical protein